MDADGHYWRAYRFIENATTYDSVESASQAFQAAKAFGSFSTARQICPRRACTTPFPIFTTRRSALRRWRGDRRRMREPASQCAGRRSTLLLRVTYGQRAARRGSAGARDAQRHEVQQRSAR